MSEDAGEGILAIVIDWIFSAGETIMGKIMEPYVLAPLMTLLHVRKIFAEIILGIICASLLGWVIRPVLLDGDKKPFREVYTTLDYIHQFITGNYSVSVFYDDKKIGTATAEVHLNNDSECRMVLFDEYSPEFITIKIKYDGSLVSDKLGTGVLTYDKALDKTTLVFTKDKHVWKMIR